MRCSHDKYDFTPDFSRQAVFSPASRPPFSCLAEINKNELSDKHQHLLAWWAVNLSHLTYFASDKIPSLLPQNCQLIHLQKRQSQLFFCTKINDLYFIAFQGSATPEDAWLDINFLPKKYDAALYHRGFLKAFSLLWHDLEKLSTKIDPQKLIICGHSLGGALAQLLSTKINHHATFTFGAPRVAFLPKTSQHKPTIHRYVNNSDVITALPPALFGFQHLGQINYIDANQNILTNPSLLNFLNQINSSGKYLLNLSWLKKGNNLLRSIADHAPINYSKALSRHLLQNSLEK